MRIWLFRCRCLVFVRFLRFAQGLNILQRKWRIFRIVWSLIWTIWSCWATRFQNLRMFNNLVQVRPTQALRHILHNLPFENSVSTCLSQMNKLPICGLYEIVWIISPGLPNSPNLNQYHRQRVAAGLLLSLEQWLGHGLFLGSSASL